MLHVIPQHELLEVRMEVHLLVHPVGNRMPVQGYTSRGRVPWQKPPGGFCSYRAMVYAR